MKTSTTILIAAGAVLAVVGVGSAVYADNYWHGPRMGFGMGMRGPGGPGDCGPMAAMVGPMVIKRVFELADTDQDGKLTQAEIDAARNQRFDTYDANKDGKLTLSEFQGLFQEVTEPVTVRAFQFLDPDGDAEITKAEYEKPGAHLVERLDRNGDGTLSRDDRPSGPPGFGHHREGPHWGGPRWGGDDKDN